MQATAKGSRDRDVTSASLSRPGAASRLPLLHVGSGRNWVPRLALAFMSFRDAGSGTSRRAMKKTMARKPSKKIRKSAPAGKRAAKIRKPAPAAKRAAKGKALAAVSASVRRERGRSQPDAKVAAVAPLAPAFSLMDTMNRLSIAHVEHAARLAACRTPMEFWFERMRFGQSLFAQWQSSVNSVLPGFGTKVARILAGAS